MMHTGSVSVSDRKSQKKVAPLTLKEILKKEVEIQTFFRFVKLNDLRKQAHELLEKRMAQSSSPTQTH